MNHFLFGLPIYSMQMFKVWVFKNVANLRGWRRRPNISIAYVLTEQTMTGVSHINSIKLPFNYSFHGENITTFIHIRMSELHLLNE